MKMIQPKKIVKNEFRLSRQVLPSKYQISIKPDSGACGYQVWNANNNYGPVLVAMKNMPEPPERCK
jgi:hypothetical protein